MSIALMTAAWKSDIASGPKMVLLSLCDNANDQGECYPSISTIAERCSMGERTVQVHIADLVRIGAVVRHLRKARSTLYQLDPKKFNTRDPESHYTYKIEDPLTGEFYIGSRTCRGPADTDGYMGSGAWFNTRVSNGAALKKTVMSLYSDRQSADQDEAALIREHISNPLCMNKRTPAESAPRRICTPQNLHPTPAESAPPPPQNLHPTPAESAPITVNEPSIESSPNRHKTLARPGDVSESVWSDFLLIRKSKKSALTETALAGIRSEAEKAGVTMDKALAMCCTRGWQSFKADWVRPDDKAAAKPGAKPKVYHDISKMDYTKGVDDDGRF